LWLELETLVELCPAFAQEVLRPQRVEFVVVLERRQVSLVP
jgi:hypothetical protein